MTLSVQPGEIVAVAGVSGNGQAVLAEVLCGQRALHAGSLHVAGQALPPRPRAFVDAGVARIPEDRHAVGVVGDLALWENAVLERYHRPAYARLGVVKRGAAIADARALVERFDVRGTEAAGLHTPARRLSGGNMQKLILGRALMAAAPRVPRAAADRRQPADLGSGRRRGGLRAPATAGRRRGRQRHRARQRGPGGGLRARRPHRRHARRAAGRGASGACLDTGQHRPGDGRRRTPRRGRRGMRLERRTTPSRAALLLAPVAAIAGTLLVASLLVAWAGAPVARAYALLLEGGFGSRFAITETLTRATPLILTGLAAAVAFRARLFNIGGEGQLYLGALAAVAVGGMHGGAGFALPAWLLFPAMMAAAALAGALLLLGPALLKSRYGVDEVVTTLLLNFIVLLFVGAMLDGPMKDPSAMGWPQSVALQEPLQLGRLVERSRVHTGLLGALALAVLLWALLAFTTLGFEIRAVGANARAAAFAGMPVTAVTVKVALLSGALAGLAGAVEVAGRAGYVTLDMSPGYGYSGIVIAMLAALHPLAVVAAAVFVAGILVGADSMSRTVGVPTYIADVIVATALIAVLVATLFTQYRVRRAVAK